MRPEWFRCETCLWYQEDKQGNKGVNSEADCMNTNMLTRALPFEYCENWTCARCFQTWDDYFFAEVAELSDRQLYTDHAKCQPVLFGNREDV
jgi:hypothetical protein